MISIDSSSYTFALTTLVICGLFFLPVTKTNTLFVASVVWGLSLTSTIASPLKVCLNLFREGFSLYLGMHIIHLVLGDCFRVSCPTEGIILRFGVFVNGSFTQGMLGAVPLPNAIVPRRFINPAEGEVSFLIFVRFLLKNPSVGII